MIIRVNLKLNQMEWERKRQENMTELFHIANDFITERKSSFKEEKCDNLCKVSEIKFLKSSKEVNL